MDKVTSNSYREYRVTVPTATAKALKALSKEQGMSEPRLLGMFIEAGYEAWVAKQEAAKDNALLAGGIPVESAMLTVESAMLTVESALAA